MLAAGGVATIALLVVARKGVRWSTASAGTRALPVLALLCFLGALIAFLAA